MTKSKLYEIYERMKELMGADQLLEEIIQSMSSSEMKESLEYIVRTHDLSEEFGEFDDEE